MSKIKRLLPDNFEVATSEIGNYMSELAQEQYEIEQASRQWELSKYSEQELYDEINRRIFSEYNESLNKLKDTLDKMLDNESPF